MRRRRRTESAPETGGPPAPSETVATDPPGAPAAGARLGEIILALSGIDEELLATALARQSTSSLRVGEILLELGAIDEETLATAVAQQAGVDLVDLGATTPDPDLTARLPESIARAHQAVPLWTEEDGHVVVAVADPSGVVHGALVEALQAPIELVVAPARQLRVVVDRTYRALAGVDAQVEVFAAMRPSVQEPSSLVAEDLTDAPVVRVVDLVLTQALRDRASDVHIEPQEERLRVRFRIDGVLHDVLTLPADMTSAVVSRIKIMAGMNIVERRRAQDGQISHQVDGRAVDVRVSTTGTIWGEKAVLRVLDKSRSVLRLDDLGMPAETAKAYATLAHSPFGMIVCAGPTGSGKTTTLYATLGEISTPELNVVTIEDPVEYVLPSINQIQVNEQADITFASTLRSTMRQDPDVILVGEVRDPETAQIAVRSALTGHSVLTSLHATDAAAAVHRLLDMGIEPFLVSSSLLAVVAQRLVRRTCTSCAAPHKPSPDEVAFLAQLGCRKRTGFVQGTGCNLCSHTGYQDRIGVYEVLVATDEVRALIVNRASRDELRELAIAQGMRPLRSEGVRLVEEGVTTIAEVARSIYVI
jgi:type IV pilus assembly protein PilB